MLSVQENQDRSSSLSGRTANNNTYYTSSQKNSDTFGVKFNSVRTALKKYSPSYTLTSFTLISVSDGMNNTWIHNASCVVA